MPVSFWHPHPKQFTEERVVCSGILTSCHLVMESRARPSPRKYGFACLTCRSRKIRCDGEKPKCKNCLKASRDCHYSYRSSDQGTTRLYTDLRQAQARVEELEQSLRTLTLLEDQQDRDQYIAELAASLDGGGGGASDANESSLSARTPSSAVTDHPSGSSNHHHSHSHSHSHSTPHQVTELDQPELIIDARGEVRTILSSLSTSLFIHSFIPLHFVCIPFFH